MLKEQYLEKIEWGPTMNKLQNFWLSSTLWVYGEYAKK
jgi:hypothetical protein